jgi:RNA polymerase sigma factor (sigma-70 family)
MSRTLKRFKIGWHFLPAAATNKWMHDATDMDLLRQYADGNSDAAFAALVSRHVDLVYSAALRKTGNLHAAEEITQAVFIILAQKAGRILDKTILPGWLYQTARLTASSFLRGEIRRVRREQEAFMQSQFDDLSRRSETKAETWEQLAPLLEDAMSQLGDRDRAAVVMRFFGGKSFAEVAAAAASAKMRQRNGSATRWKSCTAIFPNAA